ncbi:MAG: DUF4352 domain-containing protein [Peptococcaceae bacterium]|nr:DUF4352 domain-containing protein [Peptococcaceae bacterium]
MKRLWMGVLIAIMIVSLIGCSSQINSDIIGDLNVEYSTKWFRFTVTDFQETYEYGDRKIGDGYKFVVTKVSITSTFADPIPMSVGDFKIKGTGIISSDELPLSPFEGVDAMMPDSFRLAKGQSVTYDIVFEIPEDIKDIGFVYLEISENKKFGRTFTIKHML